MGQFVRAVARALFLCALAVGAAAGASGCGAQAVIHTIGATDVVVQTNVTVASESAQTYYVETNSYVGFGTTFKPDSGVNLTVDRSSGPSSVSYYIPPNDKGQALVLAAYNRATRNCYGIVQIASGLETPVLGESDGGTYQFANPHVTSAGCSAASIGEHDSPRHGWPAGDPTSSGWPKA